MIDDDDDDTQPPLDQPHGKVVLELYFRTLYLICPCVLLCIAATQAPQHQSSDTTIQRVILLDDFFQEQLPTGHQSSGDTIQTHLPRTKLLLNRYLLDQSHGMVVL